MAHTCSECTYLDINKDDDYGKFLCENGYKYVYADEKECRYFCRAYGRSSRVAESARKHSQEKQSSGGGCYITTALCKILGMEDNNDYLKELRKFRDDYLQKCDEGMEILKQYDTVGPQICECLSKDNGRFNISYILFNNYITPTVNFLKNKEHTEAIKTYTEMTTKLMKFYNIEIDETININQLEPSLSGHGRLVKKIAQA